MTRRERAALALALEVLRESVPVLVTGSLRSSPCFREGQSHSVDDVGPVLRIGGHGLVGPWIGLSKALADHSLARRLIRARLALYLRARLRAERGERGERERRVCGHCGHWDIRWKQVGRGRSERAVEYCDRCRCTWFRWVPVGPPLWQQAPAHGHWRHSCFRCGLTIDIPRGEACAECGDREPRRGGA